MAKRIQFTKTNKKCTQNLEKDITFIKKKVIVQGRQNAKYKKRKFENMVRRTDCRCIRPEMSCKKGVLRNFSNFIGKHLRQRLFLNKVSGFRPATLLKKRLWHRCFPENFVKFPREPFFIEHLWWLFMRMTH